VQAAGASGFLWYTQNLLNSAEADHVLSGSSCAKPSSGTSNSVWFLFCLCRRLGTSTGVAAAAAEAAAAAAAAAGGGGAAAGAGAGLSVGNSRSRPRRQQQEPETTDEEDAEVRCCWFDALLAVTPYGVRCDECHSQPSKQTVQQLP
jgi:hypothetical protein